MVLNLDIINSYIMLSQIIFQSPSEIEPVLCWFNKQSSGGGVGEDNL